MSDIYHNKLQAIADVVGISSDDVLACLSEDVSAEKHQSFAENGIYQKIAETVTVKNEGIHLCLIHEHKTLPYTLSPRADYVGELFHSIHQEVTKYGYTATYRCNNLFLANEAYYANLFKKYRGAGVVYIVPHGIAEIAWICRQFKMPLLLFDYHMDQRIQEFYTVSLDNRSAMQRMTKMLIDMGHRRIAHITGALNQLSARERLAGYQLALRQAGITYNPELVIQGNWEQERAEEEVSYLLRHKQAPTAIACANDISAFGVYNAVQKLGLKIPDDISVTGFDNIRLSQTCNPPLTTVHQPLAQIGKYSAKTIVQILQGQHADRHQFYNNLAIIKRESIAPPCR